MPSHHVLSLPLGRVLWEILPRTSHHPPTQPPPPPHTHTLREPSHTHTHPHTLRNPSHTHPPTPTHTPHLHTRNPPQVLNGEDGAPATRKALRHAADILCNSFDPIMDASSGRDLLGLIIRAKVGNGGGGEEWGEGGGKQAACGSSHTHQGGGEEGCLGARVCVGGGGAWRQPV